MMQTQKAGSCPIDPTFTKQQSMALAYVSHINTKTAFYQTSRTELWPCLGVLRMKQTHRKPHTWSSRMSGLAQSCRWLLKTTLVKLPLIPQELLSPWLGEATV